MPPSLVVTFSCVALCVVVCVVLLRVFQNRTASLKRQLSDASSALSTAKTDFDARQDELRRSIIEARDRETEAKAGKLASDHLYSQANSELKATLEDKARFQAEAARVEEIKGTLHEHEIEIEHLRSNIATLEREKSEAVKDAEAAISRANEILSTEREARDQIILAKDEQLSKLNEFIANAREVLSTEFKALSADALQNVSGQLIRTADALIEKHQEKTTSEVNFHKQEIHTMLVPVEETIRRLDIQVTETNLARAQAEALLNEQVQRLAGASESLTNALRKPFIRGSWGEMTLENALENAGLENEIDYVLQHCTDAEDGRQRTDAIVNLPKGRRLIIDSKNLMESYLAIANAKGESEQIALAESHSKSLRAHMKELASREYWRRYEGLDCVILFLPHDGMYHAAIRDEADLIRECSEKRIFVSNPMSLIPLLKAIRYVLDQERLNKSAEQISKIGGDLYGEISRFAENMANVGNKIKSTVNAYNEAIPGLDRFIVSKARSLKQLGAGKGGSLSYLKPSKLKSDRFLRVN